jgi:hypothetical protein
VVQCPVIVAAEPHEYILLRDPAHVAPSRSDAKSNERLRLLKSDHLNDGTAREFGLQYMNTMKPGQFGILNLQNLAATFMTGKNLKRPTYILHHLPRPSILRMWL